MGGPQLLLAQPRLLVMELGEKQLSPAWIEPPTAIWLRDFNAFDTTEHLKEEINDIVGVRDLVARGYFIPGRTSQRGGGQAPMFQCRTLSDTVRGQALMG